MTVNLVGLRVTLLVSTIAIEKPVREWISAALLVPSNRYCTNHDAVIADCGSQ